MNRETIEATSSASGRKSELLGFLFLTVVLAPVLSVALVGGYGFVIWMIQLIAGSIQQVIFERLLRGLELDRDP